MPRGEHERHRRTAEGELLAITLNNGKVICLDFMSSQKTGNGTTRKYAKDPLRIGTPDLPRGLEICQSLDADLQGSVLFQVDQFHDPVRLGRPQSWSLQPR
jgi:hypothetical protein